MKDGEKIRVKLPDGYAMFQKGDVRYDRNRESAHLRDYILTYQGQPVATLRDYVGSEGRRVKGNVAYGGFSHPQRTSWTITDEAIPYADRTRMSGRCGGTGNAARRAARLHQEALRVISKPAGDGNAGGEGNSE